MKENLPYIEILNNIMIRKGLNQQSVADILQVNQTTVSQWVLGKKKPTYDNNLSICKNFEISPNEFFGL